MKADCNNVYCCSARKKKKKEKDSVIGVTKLDHASGVTGQSDGPGIIVCQILSGGRIKDGGEDYLMLLQDSYQAVVHIGNPRHVKHDQKHD